MSPTVYEGEADFDYPAAGKPLKTWYKVAGDLASTTTATPLIVLHGGPGVGSSAYTPFFDLATSHGIPVVLYEQVGCGRSTDLRNKAAAGIEFWNDSLFVAELENLIAHLGLKQYDIVGHSWGGMFGARFAIKQPAGLRRFIIMSAAPSTKLWIDAQNDLRKTLPQATQDTMAKCEADGTTDTQEYHAAMGHYYGQFLCRLDPMPKEIGDCLALIEADPTVYATMWGPSEFFCAGTLKEWTVLDELHKISVPTLLLNGKYDEAQDNAMLPFMTHIPNVKWVQFAESSHMAQLEERTRFMKIVGTWLTA